MGKKIKWKSVESKNENDCWNIALSLATGIEYEELRGRLKPFINEDLSLNVLLGKGILLSKGYRNRTITGFDLRDVLNAYDTKNNKMVVMVDEHVFYVENETIYDNVDVEERGKFYDMDVKEIYYKEVDGGDDD